MSSHELVVELISKTLSLIENSDKERIGMIGTDFARHDKAIRAQIDSILNRLIYDRVVRCCNRANVTLLIHNDKSGHRVIQNDEREISSLLSATSMFSKTITDSLRHANKLFDMYLCTGLQSYLNHINLKLDYACDSPSLWIAPYFAQAYKAWISRGAVFVDDDERRRVLRRYQTYASQFESQATVRHNLSEGQKADITTRAFRLVQINNGLEKTESTITESMYQLHSSLTKAGLTEILITPPSEFSVRTAIILRTFDPELAVRSLLDNLLNQRNAKTIEGKGLLRTTRM